MYIYKSDGCKDIGFYFQYLPEDLLIRGLDDNYVLFLEPGYLLKDFLSFLVKIFPRLLGIEQ